MFLSRVKHFLGEKPTFLTRLHCLALQHSALPGPPTSLLLHSSPSHSQPSATLAYLTSWNVPFFFLPQGLSVLTTVVFSVCLDDLYLFFRHRGLWNWSDFSTPPGSALFAMWLFSSSHGGAKSLSSSLDLSGPWDLPGQQKGCCVRPEPEPQQASRLLLASARLSWNPPSPWEQTWSGLLEDPNWGHPWPANPRCHEGAQLESEAGPRQQNLSIDPQPCEW